MSQNQEIIEAKLCAYIDDELDAAGRADLEKHLAANPQHQRLIEELRRTAGLVRNLPRESAPPELAEGFNSQLERSVLLEGVCEDVAAADLKVPRWPQLVAMAAITLLTVGLAVVVYFALPASGEHPQIVQASPRSTTAVAIGDRDGTVADDRSHAMAQAVDAPQANPDPAKAVDSVANGEKVSRERLLRAVSESPLTNAPGAFRRSDLELAASSRSGGEHAPIVLVMHTDDPAAARKALVVYLVQQNINWEPSPAELQKKAEIGRGFDLDELRRDALKAPAEPAMPPDGAVAGGTVSPVLQGPRSQAEPLASGTTQPATQPADQLAGAAGEISPGATPGATPRAAAGNLQQYQASALSATARPAAPQPDSQPADVHAVGGRQPAVEGTETLQPDMPRVAKSLYYRAADFAISCKLTAEQAEALRSSLQQPGTSIDPLPAQLGPDALALTKEKDTTLREHGTITELPAPSKPDGNLALTPSVPTTGPAANALADTLPPAGDAAIAPAPPAPAAAPSVEGAIDADRQNGAASVAPATQPAAADAGLLDVVIVVRPADGPIASPAPPATQP